VPAYEAVASARYRHALSGEVDIFGGARLRLFGSRYWDPFNSARQPAYQILDLSAGFRFRFVEITGFADNVLDEEYFTNYIPQYRFPLAGSDLAASGRPASFGVTIEARF
jgi:iron complex outermembrane receptor protein